MPARTGLAPVRVLIGLPEARLSFAHINRSGSMSNINAFRTASRIAVIVAITCGLVEGGARLLERRLLYVADNPVFFWHKTDSYLGWRNDARSAKRVGLPIDDRGYQVYHGKNAPADAPTILCLGDSGTFGIWSDGMFQFDSFAKFLADDLACTIVNTGTVGYTSWHGVRVLKEYKGPLDAVVVRFGWNDHAHGNPMELRNADSDIAAFLNKLATGRLLLSAAWQRQDPLQPATPLEDFMRNLVTISHLARTRGTPVFYVDYPVHLTEENVKQTPTYLTTHQGVARSIRELEEVHKKYVDTTRAIAESEKQYFIETPLSSEYFSDVDAVHPNEEGARKTAQYIAESVKSSNIPISVKLTFPNAQQTAR